MKKSQGLQAKAKPGKVRQNAPGSFLNRRSGVRVASGSLGKSATRKGNSSPRAKTARGVVAAVATTLPRQPPLAMPRVVVASYRRVRGLWVAYVRCAGPDLEFQASAPTWAECQLEVTEAIVSALEQDGGGR